MAAAYGIPQAFQQAFGQAVLNKNPGDAAFFDYRFEHQGPAATVDVRPNVQDQVTSQFLDLQQPQQIALPQATTWTVRTGRVSFTIPVDMPQGTYTPYIRICDRPDCSGQSWWGWNTALPIQVGGGPLPPFNVQNATVTGVG